MPNTTAATPAAAVANGHHGASAPNAEDLGGRGGHEPRVDAALILRVGREQRAVGDDVDEARNAARVLVERVDGALRENVALRAGDAQPMAHVRARLVLAQRLQVIAPGDALRDLPHLGPIEQLAQLGLTDQDDLQQLLLRRLEVRQQPHLLEQLGATASALRRRSARRAGLRRARA